MQKKSYIQDTYKKAFTLLELVVVIGIIGVITAASVVPYNGFIKRSRDARRKIDVEQIRAALELYKSNSEEAVYPNELDDLVDNYIKEVPKDPQGKFYSYSCIAVDDCSDYFLSILLESGSVYLVQAGSALTVLPTIVNPTDTTGRDTTPTITPSAIPTQIACKKEGAACEGLVQCCSGLTCQTKEGVGAGFGEDGICTVAATTPIVDEPGEEQIPVLTPVCSQCGLSDAASCEKVDCPGGSCVVQSVSCTVDNKTNNNCQRTLCQDNSET